MSLPVRVIDTYPLTFVVGERSGDEDDVALVSDVSRATNRIQLFCEYCDQNRCEHVDAVQARLERSGRPVTEDE